MEIPIYQVDAFTREPFRGNPASVCLLPEPRPDEWLQAVAREMGLSETAFPYPEGDGYRLRWFTPTVEIDLSTRRPVLRTIPRGANSSAACRDSELAVRGRDLDSIAGGEYQGGGRPPRMSWSELSAKTFSIDTLGCERCGYSPLRVVAVVATPTREQLEAVLHPVAVFAALSMRSRAPPVGQLARSSRP